MTCLNRDEREQDLEDRISELEYSTPTATPNTGGPVSFFRFKPGWWYPPQLSRGAEGGLTFDSRLTFHPLWASQDFGIDYLALPLGSAAFPPTVILGIYSNGPGHYPGDLLASATQQQHNIQRVTTGEIDGIQSAQVSYAFKSDVEFYWLAALVVKNPSSALPSIWSVDSRWNLVHDGYDIDNNLSTPTIQRYGYSVDGHTSMPATAPAGMTPVIAGQSPSAFAVNFRVAVPEMKDMGDWDENMASWIEAHLPASISGSFIQYKDPPVYNPERALEFYWTLWGNELVNEITELHRYYTQQYGIDFADAVEVWMSSDFGTHAAVWDNADPGDNLPWDGIWSPFFEDA